MKKLPYYRMYPSDAETDENFRILSDEELGFYWRCLNAAWDNQGIPSDPERRARALRTERKRADSLWVNVSKCFYQDERWPERFVNKRQEEERAIALEKSSKNRASAQRSHSERTTERTGERSANAPQHMRVRPESESESESVVFSEGSAEGNHRRFGDEFESLIGAFLAAGVMLSDPQIYQAAQEWEHVPLEERSAAVSCAQRKAKTNEAKFMGLPASFIRKAEWTARGPGRILPEPMGKGDLAQETAERNFMRKRGMCV